MGKDIKALAISEILQRRRSVPKLHLPRNEGGKGLLALEDNLASLRCESTSTNLKNGWFIQQEKRTKDVKR